MTEPIRIANSSGFYGDRLAAAREMVEGGPIDVLTGDWLAELTLLILWKGMQRDPSKGWARTFLTQMEHVLGTCADKGIKVISNAGGLNPAGLADEVRSLAERLGVAVSVAHVEGDDLMGRIDELGDAGHPLANLDTGVPLAEAPGTAVTANAYLGAWPIAAALAGGADVVICPRVTDASLVVGPAAWHHGWQPTDWDRLAGAVAAGHLIECGTQVTGGNYAFFTEVAGLDHPGFPIAEVAEDGSSVITKHPDTGGEVSVGTVTAQLLYEIGGPDYANTDVVARFDTTVLTQQAPDRVLVSGTRGHPAPDHLKVCINLLGGWRNTMSFVLTGLEIPAKAELTLQTLEHSLGGFDRFGSVEHRLIRTDKPDAPTNAEATAVLQITAKDSDGTLVGRTFSDAVVELALAGYPGLHLTTPPTAGTAYGVFWPALVPADEVVPTVVHADGRRELIPHDAFRNPGEEVLIPHPHTSPPAVAKSGGRVSRVPLGTLVGARSGDKGGNANVGLWARDDPAWAWLESYLTVYRLRQLLPEAAELAIQRFELPNLRALNFVIVGLLGEGVASTSRPDPQAKGLGEYVRSRLVDIPTELVAATSSEDVAADAPPSL